MKILILEDDPNRIKTFKAKLGIQHKLTCIDTAEAAIEYLRMEEFDVVFLDHDLGGEQMVDTADENTGSEVVRWLTQTEKGNRHVYVTFVIHSLNTPAAESMENTLKYHFNKDNVHRINFISLVTNYLDDPSFLTND
jgi:CheY-like chemotaxis protein